MFTTRKSNNNRLPRRCMGIETMEDRKMFAADLGISPQFAQVAQVPQLDLDIQVLIQADIDLADGVLTVQGSVNSDVITIEELPALGFATNVIANNTRSFATRSLQTSNNLTLFTPRIKVTVAETNGDVLESATFNKSLVDSITVWAYGGNDSVLNDTDVPSTQYGGAGNDVLRGGTSNDTIYGHDGNDVIYGYAGNDYLSGGDGTDYVYGHDGNDTLVGGDDADYMYGHGGNDLMSGGAGNDTMHGGDDNDSMYGDTGNDNMYGSDGNDVVSGEEGNDSVYGDAGNDDLYGGDGVDLLSGSSGNDRLYGGNHADTMYGGSGDDSMYGGSGNDEMYGSSGNDYMRGDSGNDTLRGESGNDSMYGDSGNDNLYGGSGNDYMDGGSGDDGLYGGSGTDTLKGNSGDDRFLVLNDVAVKFLGFTIGYTTADTIQDKYSNDAKINFQDGKGKTFNFSGGRTSIVADGSITPAEIEQIDEALADLHHQVGNTKLLKRKNGDEITVERLGAQTGGNFSLGGVNSGDKITLLDASFNGGQSKLSRIMFHEVGHNWDNENNNWDDWKDISNWQDDFFWPWESKAGLTESTDGDWYYNSSATFARDYGRTNPMEDFATYFAKVMMEDNGMTYPWGGFNAAKEAFMDDFFASLV